MSDIKTLYKKHCKTQKREYFNNYTEMVEVLCLNPKSARKTNIRIVESVCKIEKNGQKIFLKDFIKPKDYKKAISKNENKKYSYPKLIKDYFLSLNKEHNKGTAYIDGFFYFTKSELRSELGFLSNKYTSRKSMSDIVEVSNYINTRFIASEYKIDFTTIEEYFAEIKSMANNTIKQALTSSGFYVKKVYVLFDEHWNKTYIKEKDEINAIEQAKDIAFSSVCSESVKNINRPNDLVFFKEESQKYHNLVLGEIHRIGYNDAKRFEIGYQISINDKEPELSLSMAEIKKCLSEKFHQTIITHLHNIRKHFCSIPEALEIDELAKAKAEKEKNNLFTVNKAERKRKTSVKFANRDSIVNIALINFLQLYEKNEIELFSEELEEYIINDADAITKIANSDLSRRIKLLKNSSQFVADAILQANEMIDKNRKIDEAISNKKYFDILDSIDE